MKKVFEADIECQDCGGTGLYKGMAERGASAVVCTRCNGSGCYHYKFQYTEFSRRKKMKSVNRVFKGAFGYVHTDKDVVVDGKKIKFSKGGCSYKDWLNGIEPKPMKTLYCPMQWTCQSWKSPLGCKDGLSSMYIHNCPMQCKKEQCWAIYEEEMQR